MSPEALENYKTRMKLLGVSDAEFTQLVELCQQQAQRGTFSFDFYLRDAFDMLRTLGLSVTLAQLKGGSG